jgi:hypothetical protein
MQIQIKITDDLAADGKPEATHPTVRVLAPVNAEVTVSHNDEVVIVVEEKK